MFVYIDALFKDPAGTPGENPGVLVSSDDRISRNTAPFRLDPYFVMTATDAGEVNTFRDEDPSVVIEGLGKYLNVLEKGNQVVLVGWYLDQVIIPCLCASAMKQGKPFVFRLFRKLDDKWSKTGGISLERAFFQGWYPENRDDPTYLEELNHLTLDSALKLCGMNSTSEIVSEVDENISSEAKLLMSRISSMNALHNRYVEVSRWRNV